MVYPDEIEQYRIDIGKMYNRSLNCFPCKANDEAEEIEKQVRLPWRKTIAYLLFWCLPIGLWLIF